MKRSAILLLLFLAPLVTYSQYPKVVTDLCKWVEKKQWHKTGPEIGKFLDSLSYQDGDSGKQGRRRRIKNLKAWLEAHDCVGKVRIKSGLVKEHPPQKALEVVFLLMGNENPMTLRIVLDKPYKFGGIHETR